VQYEREWLAELAQLEVRADQLSAYATLHDDPGRVNRRLAELGDITLDDVALAAADLLGPDRAAVLRYHREAADVAS
jgi:hypothetical protein